METAEADGRDASPAAATRPVWQPTAAATAAAAFLAAALVAGSWLLLGRPRSEVAGWEAAAFDLANGLPGALRWPLWALMQLGTLWMWSVGGIIAYLLTRRVRDAVAAALSVLLAAAAAQLVKDAVARARPADLLDEVTLREVGVDGHGYVSGHTTAAFALATTLTPLVPPRWRWLPLALAALVGLARLYMGVHLPLDVVGGAGLGTLCGLAVSLAVGAVADRRGAAGTPAR
ncbi:MAG TPA: phosphatase PAP2 family protein [Acidimicrobiales bacterium]